jgi:hypothetical protein
MFYTTAGIHADGDNKKQLYFNDLLRTFGRKRKYALGKLPVRLISKKSSRVRIKTKCGRSKISYKELLN